MKTDQPHIYIFVVTGRKDIGSNYIQNNPLNETHRYDTPSIEENISRHGNVNNGKYS